MHAEVVYTTQSRWQTNHDHALVVDCSDPRFSEVRHEFLTQYCKIVHYDSIIVPGGPMAATLANAFCFVDQERIKMLHALHQFHRVIGIAHYDCAAFKHRNPGIKPSDIYSHQLKDLEEFRYTIHALLPRILVEVFYVAPDADGFMEYVKIT